MRVSPVDQQLCIGQGDTLTLTPSQERRGQSEDPVLELTILESHPINLISSWHRQPISQDFCPSVGQQFL